MPRSIVRSIQTDNIKTNSGGTSDFNGPVTFNDAVTFGSSSTFNGPQTFASTVTFNGPVTANSTVTFNGPVTAASTTTISGSLVITTSVPGTFTAAGTAGQIAVGTANTATSAFLYLCHATNEWGRVTMSQSNFA